LKNPIHLKTRDLVFNRDSGDAFTQARVNFQTPQASGSAVGLRYAAATSILTLDSQIQLQIAGANAANLAASHATINREPRQIVLLRPVMRRPSGTLRAGEAIFYLDEDNQVEKIQASGGVGADSSSPEVDPLSARADQAELLLAGKENLLRAATLSGHVHVERLGPERMLGEAGRAVLEFRGQNELQVVHASDGVHLAQPAATEASSPNAKSKPGATPQDFNLNAAAIDFFVADGRRLDRAQTSGASQIVISSAGNPWGEIQNSGIASPQRTIITAARFDAKFLPAPKGPTRLSSIHGAPDAKIVSVSAAVPDRVSTSQTLDATFLPLGGIASLIQQGNVEYSDGLPLEKRTRAFAEKAVYTPADQLLTLTGAPRVIDGGMATTANVIRMNRATDDASAEGDVKSTYSDLKEQPDGAWLASSSPIHVTAASMTAHNSPATALYEGHARLWQDANLIQAPSILFDRDRRSLLAQGSASDPVTTVLVQASKPLGNVSSQPPSTMWLSPAHPPEASEYKSKIKAKSHPETEPIIITSVHLTYDDSDREAHYQGGVSAQGNGFLALANSMDVFFSPRSQTQEKDALTQPSSLDRMVASGHVSLQQPGRSAQGESLVYTASDDKFVLTGGPPSIFDAERGKITGVSLTFFRADDRVLVEGKVTTPVVTQTRVTR
jgi:lipopolysaccharide export system protein LptA